MRETRPVGGLAAVQPASSGAKSKLSRTLRIRKGCGLIRLERGKRSRITLKVMHARVELDLPYLSRKAS
jgi:hypothetical protein